MKLLRYGPAGHEKPGLLDHEGVIRDLSGHISDITAGTLEPAELARLAAIPAASLPPVDGNPRLGVPVTPGVLPLFVAVGAGAAMVVTFLGFRQFAFR